MSKKIIIFIILAVVLAGAAGGFVWYQNNAEAELEAYAENVQVKKPVVKSDGTLEVNLTQTETTSSASAVPQVFTMSEVSTHNTKTDCWMVIDGKVLDVTTFVSKHPGGDKILSGCGRDATADFNRISGHMKGVAQILLGKLEIGNLSK